VTALRVDDMRWGGNRRLTRLGEGEGSTNQHGALLVSIHVCNDIVRWSVLYCVFFVHAISLDYCSSLAWGGFS
jgi:hypothetical protein